MDVLKLFTVEEIRNLLVKWWCLYKTVDADINVTDRFMILAYKKTFEMMSFATLNGENDIDDFVLAIENSKAEEILNAIGDSILRKYPREKDFIDATASMALRLYSLPFNSEPLFGRNSR